MYISSFIILDYAVELKSSPDPIDWHLPSFDNKNFLLSSFDEWLTTQTERKSRIWSTCRKNNIPVTKKYKAPPRNIRTDSKSFYYCTNLKVKVKFSKTDWTRCPAGRIYNFEQSLSWGRQNKEVSGFDKVHCPSLTTNDIDLVTIVISTGFLRISWRNNHFTPKHSDNFLYWCKSFIGMGLPLEFLL